MLLLFDMLEIKKKMLVKIISQVINFAENKKHNKRSLACTKIPIN